MLKLLKKPIKVKTPTGYREFTGIQRYIKKTYMIHTNIGEIETAELHRFVVDKKEIFSKDLKIGDKLQTVDGYCNITKIIEGPIKEVYDLMNVQGEVYYTNGILSHNSFLGSSSTLVSSDALKSIKPMRDDEIIFNSLFHGLNIFKEPKPNRNYILTADPKQDGIDSIGLHVIDVTTLPFEQVASAKLDESFVVIPGRIFELGTYYNNAYVVQENNTEATLINLLVDQYEYEGDIFSEKDNRGRTKKNLKGIRTTTKTKKLMTSFLRKFIEEELLIINDTKTLEELWNFIEKPNGSFSAEDGYKDDLVMSLMLVFAPFLNVKDWDNFKGFIELIENRDKENEKLEEETVDFLDLGFSFESEEEVTPFTKGLWD